MQNIYEQFDAAFNKINAYIVTDKTGDLVARVTFKRGESVTCYLHIIGLEMTKGRASGGGYDRASAAAYAAICKVKATKPEENKWNSSLAHYQKLDQARLLFLAALKEGNGGSHWDKELLKSGFNVIQAV